MRDFARTSERSRTVDAPAAIDVSVIVVNYNVREFLAQALRSLQRATGGLAVEIFVVDNNSVDGSAEMVREQFPDVHLIENQENRGFGKANNQAIRLAKGRYLFILNPDTIVQEDTLSELVRFMDARPEAGAVGCKILNPDGSFAPESRRAFPTPSTAFFRICGLSRLFPQSPVFGRYNMTFLPIDREAEVDALSGSCMMVRHAALKYAFGEVPQSGRNGTREGSGAGLFDESFFMYGEDLDWCYRIQQAGWKILYTPSTRIIHYKGESTKKGELRYVRLFYGAMLRFTQKHFHNRHSRVFAAIMQVAIFARAGLTVAGNATRSGRGPILDYLFAYAASFLAVVFWGAVSGINFGMIFPLVAPAAYAGVTLLAIAGFGGYWQSRYPDVRSTLTGVGAAFITVAILSFFIPSIAYSRGAILLSFAAMAAALTVRRSIQGRAKGGRPRRTLLVGPVNEAVRLNKMLNCHAEHPFDLVGYVDADPRVERNGAPGLPIHLGSIRQLRDIVRLRSIDDVIFAADGLSNQVIFAMIQQLRGLPVHTKILAEGRDHIIGKASIDFLSPPALVEAEEAVGHIRGLLSRRAFEVIFAIVMLPAYPFLKVAAGVGGGYAMNKLERSLRGLPAVLIGRRALIGYDNSSPFCPPKEWELRPGIFTILDSLRVRPTTNEEVRRVYWFYVRNQSVALDLQIIARSLRPPTANRSAPEEEGGGGREER